MSTADCSQVPAASSVYIGMLDVSSVYALCVLTVLTVGCGPTYGADNSQPLQFAEDTREAADIAADIFAIEHGALPDRCLADARTADFIPMDPGALGVACNAKRGTLGACFLQYDVHGAIFAMDASEMGSKLLHVHELLHLLLSCAASSAAAADGDHSDAVWYHLDGVNVGQYSGEPRE